MMEDDDLKLWRGFADGRTDRWTNKQTDICDCRVAFATENTTISPSILGLDIIESNPSFISIVAGSWPCICWRTILCGVPRSRRRPLHEASLLCFVPGPGPHLSGSDGQGFLWSPGNNAATSSNMSSLCVTCIQFSSRP